MIREHLQLIIHGDALRSPQVGVGVYTQRLIRGLARHPAAPNFRVAVEEDFDCAMPDVPEEFFLRMRRRLAPPHSLLRQAAFGHRVVERVRREFPQAILHSPGSMWAPRRPARLVVTLHDCLHRHFPLYLGRFWLRKRLASLGENFAKRSDLVLTDSECSARDLAKTVGIPRDKIEVLYVWVGSEFHSPEISSEATSVRGKYGLPKRFWLYLGGFDYRKNVETLIAAYALACGTVQCPPLVLGGQVPVQTAPPYSDPVSAMRAANLSAAQVIMPGRIAAQDLPGLYAAAELLVYPSLGEGFGLPPAEAMAVGTPVLVSDLSSLPEVVPRAECRFDPLSTAAIADRLCMAARDSRQFQCPLRNEFTESFAINRYLALLHESRFAGVRKELKHRSDSPHGPPELGQNAG